MARQTVNVNNPNALETQASKEKPQKSIKSWILSYEPQIAKALPSVITPERFTRIALTAVTQNPRLAECTPGSLIGALLSAAQLGLEPNTVLGQAYLIPFKNKGVMEAQFQLGYRGLIELAHRSGELKSIEARIVYENDEFEYELGLEPKLKHKPAMKNRGDITWVYAVYHLVSGGFGFEVMSYEDIENHKKKYSQAANKGFSPWQTAWEEMAKKTVIKKALKYAPLKTDFVRAVNQDEAVFEIDKETGEIFEDTSIFEGKEMVEAEAEVVESGDKDNERARETAESGE